VPVQEAAHLADHVRAALEDFARRQLLRVLLGLDLQAPGEQVNVALALAYLGVADAVHLVRHR
jgi:hypothetical protein